MRHQKKTIKLGLTAAHRKALLANQVCSLIQHQRIKTTLAKAKAIRPLAEKMVTLGKKNSLHARRTALAVLRQKDAVQKLFADIAPRSAERKGGYTRIVKLGERKSDAAHVAFIEWVDAPQATEDLATTETADKKSKAEKSSSEAAPDDKSARKTKKSEASEKK